PSSTVLDIDAGNRPRLHARGKRAIASAWLDRCLEAGPVRSEVLPPGTRRSTIVSCPAAIWRGLGGGCVRAPARRTTAALDPVWRAGYRAGVGRPRFVCRW